MRLRLGVSITSYALLWHCSGLCRHKQTPDFIATLIVELTLAYQLNSSIAQFLINPYKRIVDGVCQFLHNKGISVVVHGGGPRICSLIYLVLINIVHQSVFRNPFCVTRTVQIKIIGHGSNGNAVKCQKYAALPKILF